MSIPGNTLSRLRQNDDELVKLDLSGVKFGDNGAQDLASVITNNTMLENLEIRNCGIRGQGAKHLANALVNNRSLKSLYLRGNKIGDEGVKYIAEALKKGSNLRHIFLGNNNIGSEGMKALASALATNEFMQTLSLRNNDLGESGGKALAKALRTNTSLVVINIANCDIEEDGVEELSKSLSINTTLRDLNCKYNDVEEDEELMEDISEKLKYNKTQNVIDINEMSKKVLVHCEAYIEFLKHGAGGDVMSEDELAQEYRYNDEELHYLSDNTRHGTATLCLSSLSKMMIKYTDKAVADEILKTCYHLYGSLFMHVKNEIGEGVEDKPRKELIDLAVSLSERVNGLVK